MRSRRRHGTSWPRTLVAALVCLPYLYPFVFLLATAVRTSASYNRGPLSLTGPYTWGHLRDAWTSGNFGTGIVNSAICSAVGVVTCCAASSLAAYWFLRHTGRLARATMGLLLVAAVIPFAAYLAPFFEELARLHLTNNLVVLGLVYGAMYTPFGLYFMSSYFRQALPGELLEAAAVDGASSLRQFLSIVVPLSRPALGTLAALAFVWAWGDLIVALILLGDPGHFTVVLSASSLVGQAISASGAVNSTQIVAAAAVINLVPMLAGVFLAQKAIVRGFMAGSSK